MNFSNNSLLIKTISQNKQAQLIQENNSVD